MFNFNNSRILSTPPFPETYQSRSRRETLASGGGAAPTEEEISRMAVDVAQAERKIQHEFGPKACIEEEPCRLHAVRTNRSDDYQPDWNEILKLIKPPRIGHRNSWGKTNKRIVFFFGLFSISFQGLQGSGHRNEAVVPAVGVHRRLHPGRAVLQAAGQTAGL